MSVYNERQVEKQKLSGSTRLFGVWIALFIPLLAFAAYNSPVSTPAAHVSSEPIAHAQLISYRKPVEPVSVPLHNVATLEHNALLHPDRVTRIEATAELNRLRTNWANSIGIQIPIWDAVAATPGDSPKIAIAVGRDLYISQDGGQSFEHKTKVLPSTVNSLAIHPTEENILYAGVEGLGFFVSRDGGNTWQALNVGINVQPGARYGITAITIDARTPQTMYIASGVWLGTSHVTFYPLGIFKTRDAGVTWTPLETGPAAAIDYMLLDGNTLNVWSNGVHSNYSVG